MNSRRAAGALVLLLVPLVGLAAAAAEPSIADEQALCGPVELNSSLRDYRERESSPYMRSYLNDVNTNHYDPAMKRLRSGSYSQQVIADLDYTLRIWPNHVPALQAMVQYELGGGKLFGFYPPACYFQIARKFAADDQSVMLLEAYYRWKKGRRSDAIALYQQALALTPNSADAHYNLGLVYFDAGEYDKALEQAHTAYSLGYPLPGLRNKLKKAGHWRDPPPAASAPAAGAPEATSARQNP